MLAFVTMIIYFILNLLVTYTNRIIVTQTSSPYLLTASHAAASYFSTAVLAPWQTSSSTRRVRTLDVRLILFSILFTLNITLSNYTLSLVSLPVHQTTRATAPALTIIISVLMSLRTWSHYSTATYLSLVPTVAGVILAAYGGRYDASAGGLIMVFLGAVTAVLKTISTHALQTRLDMKSIDLIKHTAPLAVIQSLAMAWHYDELSHITRLPRLRTLATGEPWSWESMGTLGGLMAVNALLTAALNLSSFEANRRCGALSMGVAANLKQIVILLMPFLTSVKGKRVGWQVIVGGMITVVGGISYAFAQAAEDTKRVRLAREEVRHSEMSEQIV